MSIGLMSIVWRTDLPTTEKMVLLIIADHANDEGTQSYPSQATIAKKASISIRTVQRAVNTLVSEGYIRMFKHSGGSDSCREDRRPHLYQINLNKLRGDIMATREERGDIGDSNGATLTTSTGRHSRPKNHPLEPSKEPSAFLRFWELYPRKTAKVKAVEAWEKAMKYAKPEEVLAGAERYAKDPNRVDAFTAYPATWLNQHRWNDPPLPERIKSGDEKRLEELRKAEERRKFELEQTEKWKQEVEERKAKAVPMPENVKNLLRSL